MKVSYLSLSEHRCTIQFYGCNFRCKACFAPNNGLYTEISPERLAARLKQFDVGEVMLAGGEPTLYKEELLTFITLCDTKTILSTNGFLLDSEFIRGMEDASLGEVHIDLKAYSQEVHERYTGHSNQRVLNAIKLLNASELSFEVITVFIPDIIGNDEIERIAKFLSRIEDTIMYRIIRYVPVDRVSRRPTEDEIKGAVSIAKEYLSHVISSLDVRTHPLKSIRLRV